MGIPARFVLRMDMQQVAGGKVEKLLQAGLLRRLDKLLTPLNFRLLGLIMILFTIIIVIRIGNKFLSRRFIMTFFALYCRC
jgi:hypothetical protein